MPVYFPAVADYSLIPTVVTGPSAAPPTAIIIGAGPAGLTAAFELLQRTNIVPIVLECEDYVGGISRTANYKGNRIDIGGHRFFSKSDRVMEWWLARMPMQRMEPNSNGDAGTTINYQGKSRSVKGDTLTPRSSPERRGENQGPDPETCDRVMLLRPRKSRIYFLRKFFDYPISLSLDTIQKLGLWRIAKIGFSYLRAAAFPFRPEKNLEEFFINRFGRELYRTFFKSYTEKVWGERCSAISAEWGAQRVKGLSILGTLKHILGKLFRRGTGISQKETETSLIEQFLYPKFGPGQMWETVAAEIARRGGQIVHHQRVSKIHTKAGRITAVEAVDPRSGETTTYRGDWFFSTMPVKDLVRAMDAAAQNGAGEGPARADPIKTPLALTPGPSPGGRGEDGTVPNAVREVSEGLIYRDFITVGLLLDKLKVHEETPQGRQFIRDNWIYIQEPDVRLGRLQIFNNWSPYMVADRTKVWVGLEYFCYETDDLWKMSDQDLIELGGRELAKIGIIERSAVLDATVIRMPKTYPAYFGAYDRFDEVRAFLDRFANLFLVGRNGMHRYNNQDHSMLTAMVAVDNIVAGVHDKANIWSVNTEQDYHEAKPGAREASERQEANT